MATTTSKTGIPQAFLLKNSKEISDIRADLDDLITRIPTLSDLDLDAAKAKLMQKVSATKKKPAKAVNEHERFGQGVMRALDFVKENPSEVVAVTGVLLAILHLRAEDDEVCQQCKDNKPACDANNRCHWCPEPKGGGGEDPVKGDCFRRHTDCSH